MRRLGLLAVVGAALAGCGGSGDDTTFEEMSQEAVAAAAGIEPGVAIGWKIGHCTTPWLLGSPTRIETMEDFGYDVVTDPTGSVGAVVDPGLCATEYERALAKVEP